MISLNDYSLLLWTAGTIAAIFGGAFLLFVIIALYLGKRSFKIRTGIEIWEGKPGGGKSYGVVDVLLSMVLKARRPVYTNLPLRKRVLRRYLALTTGSDLAYRYIRPLRLEHFLRFLERNQQLSEFRDEMRAKGMSDGKIEAEFQLRNGPHVVEGDGANWFPTGSVFAMDELHRWFDQRRQDENPEQLLTLLTMHRHHLFLFMVMSQDRMQISIEWRRNAVRFVRCVDKSRLPWMMGLKFPLLALWYESYAAEQLGSDQKQNPMIKPEESWIRIPALSRYTVFRLYDSFTHAGNRRRLESKLAEVRALMEGRDADDVRIVQQGGGMLWPALACAVLGFMVWEKLK